MHTKQDPLVSVLTPVYNGEAYLAECIESVLKQTYNNYEYIIINNCSTDRSLDIALEYAHNNSRIRIHNNRHFVEVIDNHNIAFALSAAEAKYCKVVSADDYLFPECIARLVDCAEANPSTGIIGSYQLSGSYIKWQGFKHPTAVFSGVDLCRRLLLGEQVFLGGQPIIGFGTPTSLLYRSEIVKHSTKFYPNSSPHADTSACFRDLAKWDFGFVYQILSYERIHEGTQSYASAQINRYLSATLNDLIQYGPLYLNKDDLNQRITYTLHAYHKFLAMNYIVGFRSKTFWTYHQERLAELGYPLRRLTLLREAIAAALVELLNPERAVRKLLRRVLWKDSGCVRLSDQCGER
jgi:glycosyltransferase involved in cell wall biosynthesis